MLNSIFVVICKHELLSAARRLNEVLTGFWFFILVCCLFPLSLTPDKATLTLLGPGAIWVAALLASLLSFNRLFRADYQDGSLNHWILSSHSLSLLLLAKVTAHWLMTGLPLVLISPILALLFHLPMATVRVLSISLLLGTPLLHLLGAFGAALTMSLRNSGLLLAVLIFPLYVPVLIFGAGAVTCQLVGLDYTAQLAWLGSLSLIGVSFLPIATAAALKISFN
jgi:heme exporter protein B